jgi:hypothetical protein
LVLIDVNVYDDDDNIVDDDNNDDDDNNIDDEDDDDEDDDDEDDDDDNNNVAHEDDDDDEEDDDEADEDEAVDEEDLDEDEAVGFDFGYNEKEIADRFRWMMMVNLTSIGVEDTDVQVEADYDDLETSHQHDVSSPQAIEHALKTCRDPRCDKHRVEACVHLNVPDDLRDLLEEVDCIARLHRCAYCRAAHAAFDKEQKQAQAKPKPIENKNKKPRKAPVYNCEDGPQCDVCLRRFARNETLRNHKARIHEGKTSKDFECPKCHKRFSDKGNLTRHDKTVHLKLREHVCEVCGRAFGLNGDLQKHIRAKHGDDNCN